MKRTTVIINGRFLQRPVTGVERYAREIVLSLDRLLASSSERLPEVTVVAPSGTSCDLPLAAIRFEASGRATGHLWEQTSLLSRSRHSLLVSLCNSAPIFHRNSIVVIHDAAVFRYPADFSFAYRTLHKTLGMALARSGAKLCTVSKFSQMELSQLLGVEPSAILILNNGAEHLRALGQSSSSIVEELRLTDTMFFLALGSASRRKNLAVLFEALSRICEADFRVVIVGGSNNSVFAPTNWRSDPRVVFAGRRSDQEIATLYKRALALIFPSRYEGFGIPPLEAFSFGCPVIAAISDAVREVCGDAAEFFGADDSEQLAQIMDRYLKGKHNSQQQAGQRAERVRSYLWSNSARSLLDEIRRRTSHGNAPLLE